MIKFYMDFTMHAQGMTIISDFNPSATGVWEAITNRSFMVPTKITRTEYGYAIVCLPFGDNVEKFRDEIEHFAAILATTLPEQTIADLKFDENDDCRCD